MTQTLEQIDAELAEAEKALAALEKEERAAVEAARQKVAESFADRRSAARARKYEAGKARREYLDANASHPWEGKRVFKIETQHSGWAGRYEKSVRIEGVVEVRRTGTEMPLNQRWDLPKIGGAFVRLCNANGRVGKRIHRDGPDKKKHGELVWQLAE